MSETSKTVDGFLFMPPALRAWISKDIPDQPFSGKIPWTPLDKSINETTFTLMTTAGLSMKSDAPFDIISHAKPLSRKKLLFKQNEDLSWQDCGELHLRSNH